MSLYWPISAFLTLIYDHEMFQNYAGLFQLNFVFFLWDYKFRHSSMNFWSKPMLSSVVMFQRCVPLGYSQLPFSGYPCFAGGFSNRSSVVLHFTLLNLLQDIFHVAKMYRYLPSFTKIYGCFVPLFSYFQMRNYHSAVQDLFQQLKAFSFFPLS